MSSRGKRYTPKQIEKYRRQKYISHLEKIGKNLFRLLRNNETTALKFRRRFSELMQGLDELDQIRLDSEYLRESENYFRDLFNHIDRDDFDNMELDALREEQMSALNRLQKIKNRSSYRKAKHKERIKSDGWE